MNRPKISVAMATYNGEKYINDQLDSILNQTMAIDELIISDDGSIDKTIEIIEKYKDNRIKIISGPKKGIKQNFANAIENTTGDIIFLSDQDDVWKKDKVDIVVNTFMKTNYTLVVHNADIVDENLKTTNLEIFTWRKSGSGIIKNIIKNTYIGCCMAFKSELKKYILPIPDDIEMHDQWIGIINEKRCGKSIFIEDQLIKYRRHGNNGSSMKHYPLNKMIKNRYVLIKRMGKSNER